MECYQFAKTEAERKMWQLCGASQTNFDMVSLCPSMVFGPPRNLAAARGAVSLQVVEGWAFGGKKIESRLVADVRDVARAHVVAADAPAAGGQVSGQVEPEARLRCQPKFNI